MILTITLNNISPIPQGHRRVELDGRLLPSHRAVNRFGNPGCRLNHPKLSSRSQSRIPQFQTPLRSRRSKQYSVHKSICCFDVIVFDSDSRPTLGPWFLSKASHLEADVGTLTRRPWAFLGQIPMAFPHWARVSSRTSRFPRDYWSLNGLLDAGGSTVRSN